MNKLLFTAIAAIQIFSFGFIYGTEDETCAFWPAHRTESSGF
jgi:hypothetical protein